MMFVFEMPTNIKHAILNHVYKVSGDAQAMRLAYNSKFNDVRDCIDMSGWEATWENGDCLKLNRGRYTICIFSYEYDELEITYYLGEYKKEIGSIKGIKTLEEALELIGR